MSRAVALAVVGGALLLAGCSGGGSSVGPFAAAPACPFLLQLAQTGQTVAQANVSNPAAFDATLQTAVTSYVRTAKQLRAAVPGPLKVDVDQLIAAVQQRRFSDALAARARIDSYERSTCKTPK